jgi:hypothetical protein
MQQTFKWYAGRSEVGSWKDVPQNAAAVVQWWHRMRDLYPRSVVRGGLVSLGEERLRELGDKYDADYVVVDRHRSPRPLLLPRVYPRRFTTDTPAYEVYRLPRDTVADVR